MPWRKAALQLWLEETFIYVLMASDMVLQFWKTYLFGVLRSAVLKKMDDLSRIESVRGYSVSGSKEKWAAVTAVSESKTTTCIESTVLRFKALVIRSRQEVGQCYACKQ